MALSSPMQAWPKVLETVLCQTDLGRANGVRAMVTGGDCSARCLSRRDRVSEPRMRPSLSLSLPGALLSLSLILSSPPWWLSKIVSSAQAGCPKPLHTPFHRVLALVS